MTGYYRSIIKQVLLEFKTSQYGLSSSEALSRLGKNGANIIASSEKIPRWLKIFLRQFRNAFFILLFLATVLTYWRGDVKEFTILVIIISVNVLVGFLQEYKADRALAELKKQFDRYCWCVREGKVKKILVQDVVVGDIIKLSDGDRVPADLRIIESKGMALNEAILTGESKPVTKTIQAIGKTSILAEQTNMAFAGTTVATGKGRGIVVATGSSTEMGKIGKLVEKIDHRTPLEQKLVGLAKTLFLIAVLGGALIFVLGYWKQGMELFEIIPFVIALLISVVPESLPTILILTLALGVSAMARKKCIVKQLPAIETLGDVDIIATDKTGTLTNNEMTVKKAFWLDRGKVRRQSFPGSGFGVKEKIFRPDQKLVKLIEAGILANDTQIQPLDWDNQDYHIVGDPTEGAINIAGVKIGIDVDMLKKTNPPKSELFFDSNYKYEASLCENKIHLAGATEVLIEKSRLGEKQKQEILRLVHCEARNGSRIVSIGEKAVKAQKLTRKMVDKINYLGFVAISDPVRTGVKEAIIDIQKAGVEVKIITGDYPATAKSIADSIGIKTKDSLFTGENIEKTSIRGLENLSLRATVFSRVSPLQKLKIIEALQRNGKNVAVTGDGVNDAPALKQAQIGIAMGQRGTSVAQEASDLVLVDDSFTTIVEAIRHGRAILENIKKFTTFLLSGNFDELLIVIFAFSVGLPAPLTAVQILWINLVSDTFPALALAFEKPEERILPKTEAKSFLRPIIKKALILGAIIFVIEIITFIKYLPQGAGYARTMVFNIAVFYQLMIVFSIRSKGSIFSTSIFSNMWLVGAVLLSAGLQVITLHPQYVGYFGSVPINFKDFILVLMLGFVGLILAEILKFFSPKSWR
ncbi:MAG: cation transport ATPase [Candidatus Berkelbacteria bacterium Licking1014_7]|uniref:Cation transport ATPase n=1 Tax=Candidatus Berkelbacteria bacterium Licking1014_7 TaxID=2017147 RepID=A0A554LJT1_9BACT|nr:MAG: cation transport ATPase [Candidatus Berkelbacteria bacterium Licking1014_7]